MIGRLLPPTPTPPPRLTQVHASPSLTPVIGSMVANCRGAGADRPVSAVTDTGAQTCCAGPEFLQTLNVPKSYLIPTSHMSVGINHDPLNILGAALISIHLGSVSALHPLYITRGVKELYLFCKAQMDLGIIHESYPRQTHLSSKPRPAEHGATESPGPFAPGACVDSSHLLHLPTSPSPRRRTTALVWRNGY